MNEKDLLDQLKIHEELEKRGFTKKRCNHCSGIGHTLQPHGDSPCFHCNGNGYIWIAPLT